MMDTTASNIVDQGEETHDGWVSGNVWMASKHTRAEETYLALRQRGQATQNMSR